jgi:hypothetical protein
MLNLMLLKVIKMATVYVLQKVSDRFKIYEL